MRSFVIMFSARAVTRLTGSEGGEFLPFHYDDWGRWHKVQMLVEANVHYSVVAVWFDNIPVCDIFALPHEDAYLGDTIKNIHPLKLYISEKMQSDTTSDAFCEFDRLKIFKKTD